MIHIQSKCLHCNLLFDSIFIYLVTQEIYVIITTIGKVSNITFKSFYTEGSNGCSLNFLQTHDGTNAGAHSLGRFCGNTLPKNGNFITTHNQVYLWFKSDHSIAGEGFQLF